MGAGGQGVGQRLAEDDRADRHAAGQAFGQRDAVGHQAVVFVGEEGAGAADARLDLIEQEQQPALVAEAAQALEVVEVGRVDAGLALDRLEEDAAGGLVECLSGGREVVVGYVAEAGHERREAGLDPRIAGGGQGRQGAAVEGAFGTDDGRPLTLAPALSGPAAGGLDQGLVSLGSAVAEHHAVEPRELDEQLGGVGLGADVEIVARMQQRAGLLADGLGQHRVGMTEGADGDAGEEVEVAAPLAIPKVAALTADEGEGQSLAVVLHQVLVGDRL